MSILLDSLEAPKRVWFRRLEVWDWGWWKGQTANQGDSKESGRQAGLVDPTPPSAHPQRNWWRKRARPTFDNQLAMLARTLLKKQLSTDAHHKKHPCHLPHVFSSAPSAPPRCSAMKDLQGFQLLPTQPNCSLLIKEVFAASLLLMLFKAFHFTCFSFEFVVSVWPFNVALYASHRLNPKYLIPFHPMLH